MLVLFSGGGFIASTKDETVVRNRSLGGGWSGADSTGPAVRLVSEKI